MKVLIAEDDPASNALLNFSCSNGDSMSSTPSAALEAWKALQREDTPQIAILDWMMPGMDGLDVCRRIREREKGGISIPMSSCLPRRAQGRCRHRNRRRRGRIYRQALQQGELRARLRTGKRIIELQTALRVANRKLLLMSRLDPLTGALNRNAILDDLDLAFYRSGREKNPLCISLVDVDNLKELNQREGRAAGDRILQDIVRRINARIRRTDCLGRYGTDEFLVVLSGVDLNTGMGVCRRIRDTISEKEIAINDGTLSVTVSQCLAVWGGVRPAPRNSSPLPKAPCRQQRPAAATAWRKRNSPNKIRLRSRRAFGILARIPRSKQWDYARRRIQRPYVERYCFQIFFAAGVSIRKAAAASREAEMGRSRKSGNAPGTRSGTAGGSSPAWGRGSWPG